MNFQDYFKGKKVTVMGLGLLGRGVGDALFIAESGAKEVIVTDLKSEKELAVSVSKLKDLPNIKFVLGKHEKEDFENVDLVLVSAGVPQDSEYLRHASEAGVPLKQSASLFAELSKIPIIGVTGTRGKSTVTGMVHHVLSVVTGEKILLGGNVRGVSNLKLLNEVKEDSLCVMELDSWQLQGFGWSGLSPQVAVFTNFMEDHLNYYGVGGKTKEEAMELYFKDKAQIFLHQDESGTLITTPEVFEWIKKIFPDLHLKQEIRLTDSSVIPEDCLLAMPGEHNRLNAALAYEALKSLSLSDEEIFEGLTSFSGVEGRLQLVKTIDNVRIYNDNNATTPQATKVALEALDIGNKNIILIAGGADKNIDLISLTEAIKEHCKQVFLTPGNGTDKLVDEMNGNVNIVVTEGLKQAFVKAREVAKNGDIILFSPAFSSFAQYKNEYERNDEFLDLLEEYKKEDNFWSGGFLYNEETKSVLLHKRDGDTEINPNKWAFFGGLSEFNESPLETFLREIKEELTVMLDETEVIPLCDYLNEEKKTYRNVFYIKSIMQKSEMKLREGADFDWIPLDKVFDLDLTSLTKKDLKFFIENYV
ncbi:MAG: UDP-N-acetylmuramoyl-L-alanine--D-glutamate ligase [Candidatus Paceibacterota bacterium]